MNSSPAVLLSISSTMATGAWAPAVSAKPITAKQYASVATGNFILQYPARSLTEPDLFFSLSDEAADKTCRQALCGELTLVAARQQGKAMCAGVCCARGNWADFGGCAAAFRALPCGLSRRLGVMAGGHGWGS